MRKPKSPAAKGPASEPPPPGGRAWARVRQFALARGLALEVKPDVKASSNAAGEPAARVKRAPKKPAKKTKRAGGR